MNVGVRVAEEEGERRGEGANVWKQRVKEVEGRQELKVVGQKASGKRKLEGEKEEGEGKKRRREAIDKMDSG